jgi:hypothetical protein
MRVRGAGAAAARGHGDQWRRRCGAVLDFFIQKTSARVGAAVFGFFDVIYRKQKSYAWMRVRALGCQT